MFRKALKQDSNCQAAPRFPGAVGGLVLVDVVLGWLRRITAGSRAGPETLPGEAGSAGWQESVGAGGDWVLLCPQRAAESVARLLHVHSCSILLPSFERHTGPALVCGAWGFCTALPAALELLGFQKTAAYHVPALLVHVLM